MATILPVIVQLVPDSTRGYLAAMDGWTVKWGPMQNGDVGGPVSYPGHSDRSIQVEGTFGAGGSVAAEGSNDDDGTGTHGNYRGLTDPQGTLIALSAGGIKAITEAVVWSRPHVTSGDGTTAVTVTQLFRNTQR